MNNESNHLDTLKSMKRPSTQNQPSTSRHTEIFDENSNQKYESNHIDTLKSMKTQYMI
jgi:hypothetical protein